ncbi:MAG: hypothetical protein LCH54_15235 [Bacteroidetes bacterium]|nr:hypothetical protein [Bacteroidota bacterium]
MNFKLKGKIFLLFLILFGCKLEPTLENNIKYSWGEKFVDSLETECAKKMVKQIIGVYNQNAPGL